MICKKCNKKHDGSFGNGLFCCMNCAKSRILSIETKIKISEGLKKSYNEGRRSRIKSEESKNKLSLTLKKQYKNGERKSPMLGRHHTIKTKDKLSKLFLGKTFKERYNKEKADIIRKKISKSSKGREPWCKGLTKETDDRVRKMNELKKGSIPWNKGLTKYNNDILMKISENQIGRKCSKETIKKISNSLLGLTGNKARNWRGGIAYEPYDKGFNNNFKRLIRKRDNQICMLCLIHRERLNKSLCVHHINYDKKMSIPENCISLCNACHMKTNGNRKHWSPFFQSLLSEKYNYQYENNLPIINLEVKNDK